MDKKNYYTISEVSQILGVSRVAVFKKIKSRKIKAIKIGSIYAIPKKELGVILDEKLTAQQKKTLREAVRKTIKDYGRTLELLGKE